MRFKTDENLPGEAAELLRSAGHDALTVFEQSLGGEPDPDLASICRREQRALVTLDLGFADIRTYPPEKYQGLIVLRLERQDKTYVIDVLERLLPMLEAEPLVSRLWIGKKNASGLEIRMPESNSPWPEEFLEFPYAISELLDDFIVLGRFYVHGFGSVRHTGESKAEPYGSSKST